VGSNRLCLTVLPLILLLTLGFDLIHADHLPQLQEPEAPEGLGEDVSELPAGLDKLDDDMSSIDAVPEKVELDADVLAPVMEDGFLASTMAGLLSTINAGGRASTPVSSPRS
jgi:hypothetical protein